MDVKLHAPSNLGRLPEDTVGRDQFKFDEESGEVLTCPAGHGALRHALRTTHKNRPPSLHAYFDGDQCRACPLKARCVARPPNNGKNGHFHLEVTAILRARDKAVAEQQNPAWWEDYSIRTGIEATNSELKRAHGFGHLRVRRHARVTLAVACKLTACNIKRWLGGPRPSGPAPSLRFPHRVRLSADLRHPKCLAFFLRCWPSLNRFFLSPNHWAVFSAA